MFHLDRAPQFDDLLTGIGALRSLPACVVVPFSGHFCRGSHVHSSPIRYAGGASKAHDRGSANPGRPFGPGSPNRTSSVRPPVSPCTLWSMTTTMALRSEVEMQVLTPEASAFLIKLAREFEPRRRELLARRKSRQQKIDAGEMPDFLPETAHIRAADWKVAPIPEDLSDRRVEITGPVDRKMIINALNSGANVFMADFEDSNSPTWQNNLEGKANLSDAVRGTIS